MRGRGRIDSVHNRTNMACMHGVVSIKAGVFYRQSVTMGNKHTHTHTHTITHTHTRTHIHRRTHTHTGIPRGAWIFSHSFLQFCNTDQSQCRILKRQPPTSMSYQLELCPPSPCASLLCPPLLCPSPLSLSQSG